MLGGNATVLLLFLLNAVFRGAGDAAIAMRVLSLGNVLNIVLGPCFIFGLGPFPELGVAGAAVATNIGRGTAVLYQLLPADARPRARAPRRGVISPGPVDDARGAAAVGIRHVPDPDRHGQLHRPGAHPVDFGSAALAGYTIGIRMIIFALLPAFGLSNAAATMVGPEPRRRTAGPRRARGVDGRALQHDLPRGVGAVFLAGAPLITRLFTPDPRSSPTPIGCLRIVSLGFLFYACGMVLTSAFNGAGDTWTPTLDQPRSSSGCSRFRWPGVLATRTGFGPRGVFFALTLAYSMLAVVSAIIFRRGGWKTRRL